jgi:hypothetical protein
MMTHRHPRDEIVELRLAEALLGGPGRMLSPTKTPPTSEAVIWNACVYALRDPVWNGDLNLTRSEPQLIRLADWLDRTIYVFEESEYVRANYERPRLIRATYRVTKDGETWLNAHWLERATDGSVRPRS